MKRNVLAAEPAEQPARKGPGSIPSKKRVGERLLLLKILLGALAAGYV